MLGWMIKKELGNICVRTWQTVGNRPCNIEFNLSVSGMYRTILRIMDILTQFRERFLRDSQLCLCVYWLFKKCE
jgi:hypothetical protein